MFFLFILGMLNTFLGYKLIRGIVTIYNFKSGPIIQGEVLKISWKPVVLIKMSYLFPKEQLKVSFKFKLNEVFYEKTEEDVHFVFRRIGIKSAPKVGEEIQLYVPKNNNPNNVTINNPNKSIKPLILLAFLFIFSISVMSLVLLNI